MYCYIIQSSNKWQPSINLYNFIHLPIYPSIHSGIWWSPVVCHLIQTTRIRDRFQLRIITRGRTIFMVNIIFSKSYLYHLLKVVCQHLMDSCIILPYLKPRDFATITSPTTSGLYIVLQLRQLIQLLLSINQTFLTVNGKALSVQANK